jgi:hypothetical protein
LSVHLVNPFVHSINVLLELCRFLSRPSLACLQVLKIAHSVDIHVFNKHDWLAIEGADRIRARVDEVLIGQELLGFVTIDQILLKRQFFFFW